MTPKPQFKVGDRIHWVSNREERGTIVEVGDAAVKVRWDDDELYDYTLAPQAAGSVLELKLLRPRL